MQFIILALVVIYFVGWNNFLVLMLLLIIASVIYMIYLFCRNSDVNNVVNTSQITIQLKQRRESLPKSAQREVWQRDGGKCVECGTKEKLCYDHIIPFSKGGSNSVRNLQLLCERCNLTKGNRI